MRTED